MGWEFRELGNLAANGNRLLVGNRTAVVTSEQIEPDERVELFDIARGPRGPDELYDTATGRFIARLDRPGYGLRYIQFSPDGRLLTAQEERRLADGRLEGYERSQGRVVFAADTGRVLARIAPAGRPNNVRFSPTGKWLLTEGWRDAARPSEGRRYQLWDTGTWTEVSLPFLDWQGSELYFATDDLMVRGDLSAVDICTLDAVHRLGGDTLSLQQVMYLERFPKARSGGELMLYGFGQLLDGRTLKRLTPPTGRRFHPRLAEAAGGRFLPLTNESAVDTRTEKVFDNPDGVFTGWPVGDVFPGAELASRSGNAVRLLPKPDRLDIPPALLELWTQVAARGELGPDGEFLKWDEPTWQQKREELAAAKPPHPDFPFPGHLARDPLYWLRKEFEAAAAAAQLPLAHELHRRSVAVGDPAETARWQREIDRRTRETAPPPRPAR